MSALLLDIDTQIDFLYPNGKLYIPGAEKILPKLNDVMFKAINTGTPIISTIDTHIVGDEEFKTYPPHCIKDSDGWWKHPEMYGYGAAWTDMVDITQFAPKEGMMQYLVQKATYNVWDPVSGNPLAMVKLIEEFDPVDIYVVGVATDICVKAAVLGLLKILDQEHDGFRNFFDVTVLIDCCAGLKDAGLAITEMKDAGATIRTLEDVNF